MRIKKDDDIKRDHSLKRSAWEKKVYIFIDVFTTSDPLDEAMTLNKIKYG